ncbi:glycoside hydrolase family 13 protein [Zopfia rhizophila CBS 207.26]|uniref:Glycoside hydrolase family 13 protein n=1 Tax=Zopfia rhizophila CBS 207.26 TaxID=1314779 RepID=A0A6A6DE30_9PEZI|nr:glycoside hydrolase family 13 protein [Zopfia rhizophila CBS 207.26]
MISSAYPSTQSTQQHSRSTTSRKKENALPVGSAVCYVCGQHLPVNPLSSHSPREVENMKLQGIHGEAAAESWCKAAVIYQIFVPSFKVTNNDGYGYLRGVIEKLDYLVNLRTNVIWLSPIFEFPIYDISNHYKVNPIYGTVDEFHKLLETAHGEGLKVILDVALNHTSAEHAWFKKSIAAHKGEDNGMNDFYIWGDPILEGQGKQRPSSNWAGAFGGSMWKWVPQIAKYYLHVFGDKQPELGQRGRPTRAVECGSFRLDTIKGVSKVLGWPDTESLGEISCDITPEIGTGFISREESKRELDLILHFEHVELDCVDGGKWVLRDWKLPELKAVVTKWQTRMAQTEGWDTIWMEKHDQPRGLTRACNTTRTFREVSAELLAKWLFSLQGTVIIYQGQELGTTNPEKFSEDMFRDIETVVFWHANDGDDEHGNEQKNEMWNRNHRTKGSFTGRSVWPWIPPHPYLEYFSAKTQSEKAGSVSNFYRKMIQLRQEHPALIYGEYGVIDPDHPCPFAYTRSWRSELYLITLNFGNRFIDWELPAVESQMWSVVMLNHLSEVVPRIKLRGVVHLRPYKGTL